MRKNGFFKGLMIMILSFGSGVLTCNCYNELEINGIEEKNEPNYEYCAYSVENAEFCNSISAKGTVLISEEKAYIDEYRLYNKKGQDAEANVKKGEEVVKGQVLGMGLVDDRKKEVLSNGAGKVIYLYENREDDCICIYVLNYESIYFSVKINYSEASRLAYDTNVYYWDKNDTKHQCRIEYIGCELDEENNIDVYVVPDEVENILPGESRELYFALGENKQGLAIAKEAVVEQGGKFYVWVKENGEYTEKEILLGEVFEVYEGGRIFYYYAVLEGFDEGDVVYTRHMVSENYEELEAVID